MPQLELNVSASVKEAQKDESPAASLTKVIKDGQVVSYDGAKRLELAVGEIKAVDVSYLTGLRFLVMELISGTAVRLRLRSSQTESTDMIVGRIFMGEILNIEKIVLVNNGTVPAVVRLFLAGSTSA